MARKLTRNSSESEKEIERYLVRRVRLTGGLCLKYSNAVTTGFPDRLVLYNGLPEIWVEVKSKGKRPTQLQLLRIYRLRYHGREVHVVDSPKQVDELIRAALARLSEEKGDFCRGVARMRKNLDCRLAEEAAARGETDEDEDEDEDGEGEEAGE